MAQRFSRVLCALPCREPIESYIGRERQMVEGGRRGGRRADGRGARQLRPARLVPGFLPPAEGSVVSYMSARKSGQITTESGRRSAQRTQHRTARVLVDEM